jgi:protein involved in polysaccharide export with SLBB domain
MHIVSANTRASEILAAAGMEPRATTRTIRLERGEQVLRVDLVAFERLGRRAANPYLADGDVIIVPENDPRWGTVEVSGAVNGPGRFGFVDGETVNELLDLGYGLTPNADTSVLELWRFHDGESAARRFIWPAGSTFSEWRSTRLQADDRVIVRGAETYREKLSVRVEGEVQRPGTYIFPKRGILLHEVIDSAGGFTPDADLERASIVRAGLPDWLTEYEKRIERLPADLRSRSETDWMSATALSPAGRVSTDFVRLFQKGQRAYEYDVLLSDGDQVVVPRRLPFVNVIGRVVQPGLVTYLQGADIPYYLQRVGGYAWRADKGGTFLVKAGSGTALKRNQIHSIEPGDMIVIPTQRGARFWDRVKETLAVASNVATIYLVIHQATK